MKRVTLILMVAALWGISLWICFWLGFLKSQVVANQTHRLDDLRSLSDQKMLLRNIEAGEVSKVRDELKERIVIGDSLVRMQTLPDYSFLEVMRYAIYPREALSLIKASSSKDKEKK